MIDVAAVNSYRMFLVFTAGTDDPASRHRNPHNIFQCNLIRQLAAIAENEPIPKRAYRPAIREPPAELDGMHLVRHSNEKRNCILCYRERDKELKVVIYCNECQAYLHVTNCDCFYRYHAIAYAPHDSSDDSAGSSDCFMEGSYKGVSRVLQVMTQCTHLTKQYIVLCYTETFLENVRIFTNFLLSIVHFNNFDSPGVFLLVSIEFIRARPFRKYIILHLT